MSYLEKSKRKCRSCGKPYIKNKKFSISQWSNSKYCSFRCAGDAKKIKDGMTNRIRFQRRHGHLEKGSVAWIEKIRAKTTEAMLKPEINWKLHQPRKIASLESRIRHSNLLAGRMPKNTMFGANNYPNIQRGDYENSKGSMYFRSKWEANYALYLDWLVKQKQIKEWEYEKDVFIFTEIQFGTRSYRPDFKVFTNDGKFEYHEVKGYMDSKSKTKLKRMAKYYPEAKLILIDSIYYRDLAKKIGKMLNFY